MGKTMKNPLHILIPMLLLGSCATSTFEGGQDFNTARVSSIAEGQTTQSQILDWFGEPQSKSVSGGGVESWSYAHSVSSAEAQSMVFKIDVETTSAYKSLVVTFVSGVVSSYTFVEG